MNFLKRALLSIKRKPGKSLLLFLIVFILCNVIAGAVSIQLGTENVEKNIKESLGAVYSVQQNWEEISEDEQEAINNGEEFDYQNIAVLDESIIQSIGDSPYVKAYDYNLTTSLGSENVEPYHTPEMIENFGEDYLEHSKEYAFNLKGVHYAPILTIEEGKQNLVDGRVFTEEEVSSGANVAVVNKKFADFNNLTVGDDFVLTLYFYDWENVDESGNAPLLGQYDAPLNIIGIHENIEEEEGQQPDGRDVWMAQDQEFQAGNSMYVPNGVISTISREYSNFYFQDLSEEDKEAMNQEYYTPIYILNGPDDADNFITDTEAILPKYYHVISNDSSYQQIAGPLQQTSRLAGYVLYVAIAATILIITLVVLLFLRDRKHELGIYMSLGEKRGRVLTQILAEVLIIALIAITLSVFTGNILASGLSNSMVRDRLTADAQQDEYFYNDNRWIFGEFSQTVTQEDLAENYKISLSPAYIGLIYLIGLGSVIVATLIPMFYILRLNPKKVLM